MHNTQLISSTKAYVQQVLQSAEGGHDYWHSLRVWKIAKHIAQYESANTLVVELAALLHDIADAKFHNGDELIGAKMATHFLKKQKVDVAVVQTVAKIVENVSFKGGQSVSNFHSLELQIVQDADRLDAIGAIGIARAFNYGGYKGRSLYIPEIAPKMNMLPKEYRKHDAPTINHFYEKLLLLADKMHTNKAKEMAKERHQFLELFLKQFYKEWEGDC